MIFESIKEYDEWVKKQASEKEVELTPAQKAAATKAANKAKDK